MGHLGPGCEGGRVAWWLWLGGLSLDSLTSKLYFIVSLKINVQG